MFAIVAYLMLCLLAAVTALILHHLTPVPPWYLAHILYVQCAAMGATGGVLYCLRGVYLAKCVHQNWDPVWSTWYVIRPVTSTISGFASAVFLQAGVLVLGAAHTPSLPPYGFWALAFVAGYNVDNFLKKLESAAQTLWSIEPSRAGRSSRTKEQPADGEPPSETHRSAPDQPHDKLGQTP